MHVCNINHNAEGLENTHEPYKRSHPISKQIITPLATRSKGLDHAGPQWCLILLGSGQASPHPEQFATLSHKQSESPHKS